MTRQPDPGFWRGRRVLLTGHTGFKGAWLALLLERLGATVTGFALPPAPGPAGFTILAPQLAHREGDLRDAAALRAAVAAARPQVVLHLAAQALVGRGYREPAATFATNVTGTINLLEALRGQGAGAVLVVTSDKVYRNDDSGQAFVESDPLGGQDPYSASKAACEIAVQSWRAGFGAEIGPIATARAGNVIGGGD
ncbi:MAG TPA: NAD-dependent epimerase/dehydratase family protein, partial [Roseomonas sp.]